jgi:hypothetical protein
VGRGNTQRERSTRSRSQKHALILYYMHAVESARRSYETQSLIPPAGAVPSQILSRTDQLFLPPFAPPCLLSQPCLTTSTCCSSRFGINDGALGRWCGACACEACGRPSCCCGGGGGGGGECTRWGATEDMLEEGDERREIDRRRSRSPPVLRRAERVRRWLAAIRSDVGSLSLERGGPEERSRHHWEHDQAQRREGRQEGEDADDDTRARLCARGGGKAAQNARNRACQCQRRKKNANEERIRMFQGIKCRSADTK